MLNWLLLYLAGYILLILLVAWYLPKTILKDTYIQKSICDRGIKKCKLPSGETAVVYEPETSIRKYIGKYALYEKGNEKYISFKTEKDLRFVDLDLMLYDKNDRPFLQLCSKSIINEGEELKEIKLPPRTAYVSLSLNRANEESFGNRSRLKISGGRITLFSLCVIILSVGFAFLSKWCCANLFAGIFREEFMKSGIDSLIIALSALAACFAGLLSGFIMLLFAGRK